MQNGFRQSGVEGSRWGEQGRTESLFVPGAEEVTESLSEGEKAINRMALKQGPDRQLARIRQLNLGVASFVGAWFRGLRDRKLAAGRLSERYTKKRVTASGEADLKQ